MTFRSAQRIVGREARLWVGDPWAAPGSPKQQGISRRWQSTHYTGYFDLLACDPFYMIAKCNYWCVD